MKGNIWNQRLLLILVIEQQRIYQSFIYNFSLHANTLEYTHNDYFVFVLDT